VQIERVCRVVDVDQQLEVDVDVARVGGRELGVLQVDAHVHVRDFHAVVVAADQPALGAVDADIADGQSRGQQDRHEGLDGVEALRGHIDRDGGVDGCSGGNAGHGDREQQAEERVHEVS